MKLIPSEIIFKKAHKATLLETEIEQFFLGYMSNTVTDYQMSAMLMAILINGMNLDETTKLTQVIRDTGMTLPWSFSKKIVIDKHSTGGVGDKTSLIILPLCACAGLKIPMIAGRGLGHSGGTVDKLEAIPGMNLHLPVERAQEIVALHGGVFLAQTDEIAPLDKKLYALRDVTATVESIPLITSSILSKKLSEGLDGLVLDVKFGSGAFMQDPKNALALAESLVQVGQRCDLKVRCLLTDMGVPLGRAAGNALEVVECLDILNGKGPDDCRFLAVNLAAEMICLADPKKSLDQAKSFCFESLKNGEAMKKFCDIVSAQGGCVDRLASFREDHASPHVWPVYASSTEKVVVESVDVRQLGVAIVDLGGGRKHLEDAIDFRVGLTHLAKPGEIVSSKDPIALVHAADDASCAEAANRVQRAYKLGHKYERQDLIWRRL